MPETSKSYVHGSGSSISVSRVKPCATVEACSQANGRSVSANRVRSPNRSSSAALLGIVVPAALRLDADLRPQGQRVHARAGGLLHPDPGQQVRRGRVPLGDDVDDAERQLSHRRPPRRRAGRLRRRQVGEERVEQRPGLLAAVEPAPDRAQRADQLVAAVDRHQEGRRVAGGAVGHAHDQRLDVGGEGAQHGVGVHDAVPGAERELALGGAGRPGIEGDRAAQLGVGEEERQPDRDLQLVPLARRPARRRRRTGTGRGRRGSAARRPRR